MIKKQLAEQEDGVWNEAVGTHAGPRWRRSEAEKWYTQQTGTLQPGAWWGWGEPSGGWGSGEHARLEDTGLSGPGRRRRK